MTEDEEAQDLDEFSDDEDPRHEEEMSSLEK